jgi:hypothetical protein
MDAYVAAGYGVTLVTLSAYALRVVRRSRALSRSALLAPARVSGDGSRHG